VPAKDIERVGGVLAAQRESFALRNVIATTPSGAIRPQESPRRARRGEFRRVESLPAMRILHVTDFHFREQWFHWLAAQALRYDVCCFSGDLLDMFPGSRIGLRPQTRWVRDWAAGVSRLPLCLHRQPRLVAQR